MSCDGKTTARRRLCAVHGAVYWTMYTRVSAHWRTPAGNHCCIVIHCDLMRFMAVVCAEGQMDSFGWFRLLVEHIQLFSTKLKPCVIIHSPLCTLSTFLNLALERGRENYHIAKFCVRYWPFARFRNVLSVHRGLCASAFWHFYLFLILKRYYMHCTERFIIEFRFIYPSSYFQW